MPALRVAVILASLGAADTASEIAARAEREDTEMAFAEAVSDYEEAIRRDPTSAIAARARTRRDALRAHSEGNFEPLRALERVRRSPTLASDGGAIDALVQSADSFPPGRVRLETWTLAGEAYADRLTRPDDAALAWRHIIGAPEADPIVVNAAARRLVALYVGRGDFTAAAEAAHLPDVDASLARDVRTASRRAALHRAASIAIAGTVTGAIVAIARGARAGQLRAIATRVRRSARSIALFSAYVATGGALLAAAYEQVATAKPFLLLGVVLAPLLLLARAWSAASSPHPLARAGRAAACFVSAASAAFLILESVNADYLRGIGL